MQQETSGRTTRGQASGCLRIQQKKLDPTGRSRVVTFHSEGAQDLESGAVKTPVTSDVSDALYTYSIITTTTYKQITSRTFVLCHFYFHN